MKVAKIFLSVLFAALAAYIVWWNWLRPEYSEIVRDGSAWPGLIRNSPTIGVFLLLILFVVFTLAKKHLDRRNDKKDQT